MRKLLTLLLAMLLVCSCSTMRAPAKLDRLVDRVERHADRYTLSDWQRVGRKYDELVKEYVHNYRHYTTREKQQAMAAIGRFHGLLVDHGIKESVGVIGSLGSYVGGLVDILKQDTGAVRDFIQDVLGIGARETGSLIDRLQRYVK